MVPRESSLSSLSGTGGFYVFLEVQETVDYSKTLNLPETVTPLNIVYVGHPAEEKPARTQFDQAKISHNLFNLPWKLPTDQD